MTPHFNKIIKYGQLFERKTEFIGNHNQILQKSISKTCKVQPIPKPLSWDKLTPTGGKRTPQMASSKRSERKFRKKPSQKI